MCNNKNNVCAAIRMAKCHALIIKLMTSRRKSKSTTKKIPSRSSRTGAVTRATSHQQPVTTSQDATSNPTSRVTKRRSNDSPRNPPATKRPRRQGLTKNNVSRVVKLVLDAINDNKTDQDAEEIETPTVEETEDKSVTQEVQNSIGM